MKAWQGQNRRRAYWTRALIAGVKSINFFNYRDKAMTLLRTRIKKLELKNRQLGPALIFVKDGETQEEALQRCYPGEKPKMVIYLDKWDLLC
jgi:hypothetical protein